MKTRHFVIRYKDRPWYFTESGFITKNFKKAAVFAITGKNGVFDPWGKTYKYLRDLPHGYGTSRHLKRVELDIKFTKKRIFKRIKK